MARAFKASAAGCPGAARANKSQKGEGTPQPPGMGGVVRLVERSDATLPLRTLRRPGLGFLK